MAIKITGAVLIIITSCIIGYLLSIKEDLRCRDLSEIEKILQNIFSQIDYKKRGFDSGNRQFYRGFKCVYKEYI